MLANKNLIIKRNDSMTCDSPSEIRDDVDNEKK